MLRRRMVPYRDRATIGTHATMPSCTHNCLHPALRHVDTNYMVTRVIFPWHDRSRPMCRLACASSTLPKGASWFSAVFKV